MKRNPLLQAANVKTRNALAGIAFHPVSPFGTAAQGKLSRCLRRVYRSLFFVCMICSFDLCGFSAQAEPPVWVNVTNDLGGDAVDWAMSTLTLGVAPGTDTVYAHIGPVGLLRNNLPPA